MKQICCLIQVHKIVNCSRNYSFEEWFVWISQVNRNKLIVEFKLRILITTKFFDREMIWKFAKKHISSPRWIDFFPVQKQIERNWSKLLCMENRYFRTNLSERILCQNYCFFFVCHFQFTYIVHWRLNQCEM